jgi:hypothetical protein
MYVDEHLYCKQSRRDGPTAPVNTALVTAAQVLTDVQNVSVTTSSTDFTRRRQSPIDALLPFSSDLMTSNVAQCQQSPADKLKDMELEIRRLKWQVQIIHFVFSLLSFVTMKTSMMLACELKWKKLDIMQWPITVLLTV